MELWDVLDKSGKRTGKTVIRGKRGLAKGEYHLVVHIWIVNDSGMFLLQRRADDRQLMPGEWAATGGAVLSDESSRHAAARELNEELGISIPPDKLVLIKRLVRRYSINDIWAVKCNTAAEDLTLQKEEVAEVRWAAPDELRRMIADGRFHNYGKGYFDVVFSVADKLKNR